MLRRALLTPLLLSVFFAVIAPTLRAMSVDAPSFPELVDEAATVVRARVTAIAARKVATPAGEVIKTFVTFDVGRALKGAPDRTVTLSFLGGQIGEERWEVPGMPAFEVGAEEFLFITPDSRICPLVGAMHGRYRVVTAQKAGRPYVARDDGAPLVHVGHIQRPMESGAARSAAASDAISPEAFEQLIADEIAHPTRPVDRP